MLSNAIHISALELWIQKNRFILSPFSWSDVSGLSS